MNIDAIIYAKHLEDVLMEENQDFIKYMESLVGDFSIFTKEIEKIASMNIDDHDDPAITEEQFEQCIDNAISKNISEALYNLVDMGCVEMGVGEKGLVYKITDEGKNFFGDV